ncbi:hypothetical protein GGQ88_003720 [Novosphingobium hassiacum]|uniref:Uncharacterized protein n=1 Tax=Novosphingobium hassiacum TaxID=173676 RepID=A0A7W5ZYK9_9SPHN|nr:hypothetical protein [Novosphingobium hassiacum]
MSGSARLMDLPEVARTGSALALSATTVVDGLNAEPIDRD